MAVLSIPIYKPAYSTVDSISPLQSYVPHAKALANHPTCIQAVGQKILAKMEMAIPEPTQVDSELTNDTEVSDNCSLVNSCKKFV